MTLGEAFLCCNAKVFVKINATVVDDDGNIVASPGDRCVVRDIHGGLAFVDIETGFEGGLDPAFLEFKKPPDL